MDRWQGGTGVGYRAIIAKVAIQFVLGKHRLTPALVCTMCLAALLIPACRRSVAPAPAAAPPAMRIVCLSPAVTDLLIALELGDRVVGRDTWEEQLSDSIPRVGDLTTINLEAILALDPTDVVLQAGRIGLPPRLAAVASERNWNLINLQIDGLPDIHQAIRVLAEQLTFAGEPQLREVVARRADQLIEEIDHSLAALPAEITDRLGPILMLYFTKPPSAYGPGSYVSDILESLGGRNAISGGAWQELDLEQVAATDPWAMIIASPGASDQITAQPEMALESLARLDLMCVREGRLAVLRHPRSQLPSASVVGIARELRAILERFAQPSGAREP